MRTKIDYRGLWIKYNKKSIPFGYHIHHVDGNSHNNSKENLIAVSPLEHMQIHERQGDVREAAMLRSKIFEPEFPCYSGTVDTNTASWLHRNQHGLIRIPEYSKKIKGIEEPEIELHEDMTIFDSADHCDDRDYDFLYTAMNSLSNKERYILDRRYGIFNDRMKMAEISDELGMSLRGVEHARLRAINKLRVILI